MTAQSQKNSTHGIELSAVKVGTLVKVTWADNVPSICLVLDVGRTSHNAGQVTLDNLDIEVADLLDSCARTITFDQVRSSIRLVGTRGC